MTSGNLSEEPIVIDNDTARQRLSTLADSFLMHDRRIQARCDDSVIRATPTDLPQRAGNPQPALQSRTQNADKERAGLYPIRRARGFAPVPLRVPWETHPLLAVGGELKNTFCLARRRYAFLSHHIGDLDNYETLSAFQEAIAHFERLFRVRPEALAHDLHPDYLSTRYAQARAEQENLPVIRVQHHHAHIAACMVEHGLAGDFPVIGVSFDGTGYGDDGAIWGGEFLIANYQGYQRAYHLAYVPLPGGDQAIREPWRMALSWLNQAAIEWSDDLPPVRAASFDLSVLRRQLTTGLNAPPTSSIGRLFDAVSALTGVRCHVNYEAQAAIELEARVDGQERRSYPFEISGSVVDPAPLFHCLVADLRAGVPTESIAARFHNGLAAMVHRVCNQLRERHGISHVVLSGGVWQNVTLLAETAKRLREDGYVIYCHRRVPANDGGLSIGQVAIARHSLEAR